MGLFKNWREQASNSEQAPDAKVSSEVPPPPPPPDNDDDDSKVDSADSQVDSPIDPTSTDSPSLDDSDSAELDDSASVDPQPSEEPVDDSSSPETSSPDSDKNIDEDAAQTTNEQDSGTELADPLVDMIIDDRYRIERLLARGGMATVYYAYDQRLERPVAIKVMHPHLAEQKDFVQRFRREARSAARISHPNVVTVFDQGVVGGSGYLVMELVNGPNLRKVLNERGALTLDKSLAYTEAVLHALVSAHSQGVIHRDIKPENVLIPNTGQVKVADFGLAAAASDISAATTGSVMGTVAYLPPELVSENQADPRSDLYSLGIMLFEMITGRTPFEDMSAIQIALAHVNQDIPAPSTLESWVPSEVDDFVCSMAAREMADRPQSAQQALEKIIRLRSELPQSLLERRSEIAPAVTEEETDKIRFRGETVQLPVMEKKTQAVATEAPKKKKKKKRRTPLIIATIITLLIAAGAGFTWWWFEYGPGSYIDVPQIAGATLEEGQRTLEPLNVQIMVEEAFDDVVPEGIIIDTRPSGGDQVHKSGVVTILVSKGIEMVDVPDLNNKTADEIDEILKGAKLTRGDTTEQYHEEIPKGQVISQSPAAGESVKHDSPVNVVISKGREPIEVPNVVGKSSDEAQKMISDAGLQVQTSEAFSDDVERGLVISQDPAGGETRYRTDPVAIVISKGPEMVTVPNVIRMSEAEARAELEALGLVVEVDRVFMLVDMVATTNPPAGTSVRVGSTVTIRVV